MQIVLHSDDILLLEHWGKPINEKYLIVDDLNQLLQVKNSLIIVNYSACNGKCEVILQTLILSNKVLVLHRTPNISTAKQLLALGASGYGNAMMRDHFIISAIDTLKDNMIWLHPEFTTMLIMQIPPKGENINDDKLEMLSEREKQVAYYLKDGATYKDIAKKLDITARTVKAHAAHIYKKLSVKDRLGLALFLK
jgi:two-component system, NarL family, response regulator LiaR